MRAKTGCSSESRAMQRRTSAASIPGESTTGAQRVSSPSMLLRPQTPHADEVVDQRRPSRTRSGSMRCPPADRTSTTFP